MRVPLTALLATQLAAGAVVASEIAPGAVAHHDVVYAAAPRGGVTAFDAATGARRWTAPEAARPLAADGARLLAQAESASGLRLLILDTASGRVLSEAVAELPEGVTAPVDDTGETRFLIRVEQAQALVRLDWTWTFRPMRGVLEEDGDDGSREAKGAVLVNLADGRVSPAAARVDDGPERLPLLLSRDAEAGVFRERPRRVGPMLVATQDVRGALVLRRFTEDATAMPDVALPDDTVLQLGSADGRHLLVSREVTGAPLASAHEWTVMALDTGVQAAALRTSTAAAGFAVTASRVLVVHQPWEHRTAGGWQRDPRRLEAFDRATGARVWAEEIRDSAYRGPVAP